MKFDDLVYRCIMEQEWTLPDRDDPRYQEVQREIDQYTEKLNKLYKTFPSGARFWGPLALAPGSERRSPPEKVTREQAIDYGLPPKEYTFIGSGAESVVYGDGEYVYKFPRSSRAGRSHRGHDVYVIKPEDEIEQRFRKCRKSKDIDNLPPIELADIGPDKFFLHYSKYKDIEQSGVVHPVDSKEGVSYDAASGKVIFPPGVKYHPGAKGFAVVRVYAFNTLGLRCMDNGIIVQRALPRDAVRLTYHDKSELIDHMDKKHGIHVDRRNIGINIMKGERDIYVMDD